MNDPLASDPAADDVPRTGTAAEVPLMQREAVLTTAVVVAIVTAISTTLVMIAEGVSPLLAIGQVLGNLVLVVGGGKVARDNVYSARTYDADVDAHSVIDAYQRGA